MRLFLAADLEEPTKHAAVATFDALERGLVEARAMRAGDAKWVAPDAMHLTLHFLGELSEPKITVLRDALAASLETPAFSLSFGGVGFFPPAGRPHVAWLAITAGDESLSRVYAELEPRIRTAEIEVDRRPYRPHLTLARFKRAPGAGARAIAAALALPPVPASRVDHVTLYESRLSSAGATHVAMLRLPLAPAASV